jgi:L-histidine N-alpha-methyltransferase
VQYAAYSGQERLTQWYHTALVEQQNIVLQASSLKDPVQEFALSVAGGLASTPRRLECRFLYDAQGSALYEQICAQPEYYPTRIEEAILQQWAPEISVLTGPCTLIELGSGSSIKTGHLLSAYQNMYRHVCYTPIDISGNALKHAGRAIIDQRPEIQVVGIHGTYSDSFPLIRFVSPALVIFLGSTIGNFTPAEERIFWSDVTANMQTGDYFLLGVDLIKDRALLEAAYNDQAGITARFTQNYFARMNRELDAAIDLDAVEHKAWYNSKKEQVEIYGQFHDDQQIHIRPLKKSYGIGRGESILLEISRKFHLAGVQENLADHGLQPVRSYTDPHSWFGLLLLEKKGP